MLKLGKSQAEQDELITLLEGFQRIQYKWLLSGSETEGLGPRFWAWSKTYLSFSSLLYCLNFSIKFMHYFLSKKNKQWRIRPCGRIVEMN